MRTAVIVHKGGEVLAFVCKSCYDETEYMKFAECEQHTPTKCDKCKRWIGWEEDRKITPRFVKAVR